MKKLKKLPIVLAMIVTVVAAACSDIDVTPRADGDDDDEPIVVDPIKSNDSSADSLSIG